MSADSCFMLIVGVIGVSFLARGIAYAIADRRIARRGEKRAS